MKVVPFNNMLSIKASWSGRTLALARCSDSPGKKTRRRLTKETRRTMVESFIKKYQGCNNGDFPSLNLTHKEVGGSFYTVREIVRELIQENRVLRPGNPSSTALSLEDCLDEYPVGSLSMAPIAIDQEDYHLLSNENQILAKESCEVVISEPLELSFHPNGYFGSSIINDKSSDYVDQNFSGPTCISESLTDVDSEEEDSETPSGLRGDLSGANGYLYSEPLHTLKNDSDHIEQPVLLEKPCTPVESGKIEEFVSGSERNSLAGQTNLFENNGDSRAMPQDVVPETTTLSNSGNHDLSSLCGVTRSFLASDSKEVPLLASISTETSNSEESSIGAKGSSVSLEATEIHTHEIKAISLQAETDPATKKVELTESLSSSLSNGAVTSQSSPLTPSCKSAEVEPQSVLKPSHKDNIESYSLESSSLDAKGLATHPVKVECEDIGNRSRRESILSSTSGKANEEHEKEEINPIWAAVKAFVASVVKFWTE